MLVQEVATLTQGSKISCSTMALNISGRCIGSGILRCQSDPQITSRVARTLGKCAQFANSRSQASSRVFFSLDNALFFFFLQYFYAPSNIICTLFFFSSFSPEDIFDSFLLQILGIRLVVRYHESLPLAALQQRRYLQSVTEYYAPDCGHVSAFRQNATS